MPYSQHEEETIIVEMLGATRQVGHFLDVGAYDGKTFSNTLRLVELGWSGVCVEPSPSVFPALLKLHCDNPKIVVVNTAVAPSPGFIDFYDSNGDALSTFNEAHRKRWAQSAQVPFRKMSLYAVNWAMLFGAFSYLFDFINLDVEGISADLFMQLPLQRLATTKALIVEHDGRLAEIQQHAAQFGFQYHWHNNENLILERTFR